MLRVAQLNALDFSVILGVERPNTTRLFHLRRYNGKAHEHANRLERTPAFYDYHIHRATERYQRTGSREEHYAEVTNRYVDLHGAFACLVEDCGFVLPEDPQMALAIGGSLL
jgi:hypothetical protein